MLSADAVKAAGARVMAVGVGDLDQLSTTNLALVSGPVEGTDFAVTSFADVDTVFRELAEALCPGREVPVERPPAPEPPPAAPPVTPRFTG